MIRRSSHRDNSYGHTVIQHRTYYGATVRPCYMGGRIDAWVGGSILNPEIDP